MAYMGHKPLSETAPNHPFARAQISFGVKRPGSPTAPTRTQGVSENRQSPVNPPPTASVVKGNDENNDGSKISLPRSTL